jgi:hypothetical protein
MLSRPSSRLVDFGEVLKRARPSGNEAKRPSCSAKYRLRVCTHPIRLLQGSSAGRVHVDFVIHGKMDLSETERLRRVSRPRVVSSAP